MASIGAVDLLSFYGGGSCVQVAQLLLLGLIPTYEEEYALESVNEKILSIARTRLEWKYGQNPIAGHREDFQAYKIYNQTGNSREFRLKIKNHPDFKILKWISEDVVIVRHNVLTWQSDTIRIISDEKNWRVIPYIDV